MSTRFSGFGDANSNSKDQLEVSDEFKAKIQRAKQEIADGTYSRTRKPEAGR